MLSKLRINDKIDETMLKKLYIEEKTKEDEEYLFKLDEWAVFTNKPKFTEKLHMRFIKLWSILRIPILNFKAGTCEWRIRGKDNEIYIIKCSKEESGKSLMERENWVINANTDDKNKIKKFFKHFGEAIDCYEKYYSGIEDGNFIGNNKIVQDGLDEIKYELYKNSTLFNTNF